MAHNKNIYIIADLHLNEGHAEMAQLFKNFLEEITSEDNCLYILGDFFDYWIGDNHKDEFYHLITGWLKKASNNGLTIFFMHGNRDFLIGKKFAKKSGVKILKDPYYTTIAGKKILFSHGDLFCTDDVSYQKYRKWIAYNYPLRFIFRRLPLFLREKTAKNVRSHSYTKNRKHPDVNVTKLGIEKYKKDCDIIIHGHTHRMNTHYEKDHTRYVVGDWYKTGNYLKISKDGEIELVKNIEL